MEKRFILCYIAIFYCKHVHFIHGSQKDVDYRSEREYMIQIKNEWLELVKSQSKTFGLKFHKKIVSNIYLFEAEDSSWTNNTIEEFKKVFADKVLDVELREYSKVRFVTPTDDSPAPPGFLTWVLTKRPKRKLEITWPYYGMDIQEAWSLGRTGQGIVVAVVDTGVDFEHHDLKKNINRWKSQSFATDDTTHGEATRLPFYPETDIYTSHGTKAAGLIAAEFGNGVCSAGVAFNATLISLKVIKVDEHFFPDGLIFPDDYITQGLEYRRSEIDIYSCSFGLANMFSESTNHIRTVLKEGVAEGRNGKGSIFVFSAGNLGNVYDCNTVPYSNSIYTVTIASVGKHGTKPHYAMPCSSVLAATYGEYKTFDGSRKLNTTTLEDRCDTFVGTSASTAIAAGIIALVLQENKNLTWRDIQHIIVLSSSFEQLKPYRQTTKNGKGHIYNPYFGFGLMNATAAVLLARGWTSVPERVHYRVLSERSSVQQTSIFKVKFPPYQCPQFLEYVTVLITYNITASMEKYFQISLRSPAKTRSILLRTYKKGNEERVNVIERKWNFTSVQFWGESPVGVWSLHTTYKGSQGHLPDKRFRFISALFTFIGTATDPYKEKCSDCNVEEKNQPECTTEENIVRLDDADSEVDQNVKCKSIAALLMTNGLFLICLLICAYLYLRRPFRLV